MKYAQLGFLILIPSLFAFISASYFLSTVFERHPSSQLIAVGGGVFWAIVVFSLDRFLVMTVKKSKSILRDLFSVSILSRMALAVLIGYVVAHPLVLKLFEPNLQEILMERNAAKEEIIRKQWDEKIKLSETELTGLTERMEKLAQTSNSAQACVEDPELQRLIKLKQDEISATEQDYAGEVAGKAKKPGPASQPPTTAELDGKHLGEAEPAQTPTPTRSLSLTAGPATPHRRTLRRHQPPCRKTARKLHTQRTRSPTRRIDSTRPPIRRRQPSAAPTGALVGVPRIHPSTQPDTKTYRRQTIGQPHRLANPSSPSGISPRLFAERLEQSG
jgi:hypothetical protein